METVTSLSEIERMDAYREAGTDAFLCGSRYSLRFGYSLKELEQIVSYAHGHDMKVYVSIDAFIFEDELDDLKEYLDFLRSLSIDGLYFNDLCLLDLASDFNLIYDPDTLMTNINDVTFMTQQVSSVVLAREITFEEVKEILELTRADMQVFGHCKLSYSKRKFLSNYFSFIKKEVKLDRNIILKEEKREAHLPIVEDEYGTRIYSDYVLSMFNELDTVKDRINHALIEDAFLPENLVCSAIRKIKGEDIDLEKKYPDTVFSTGFLYMKTDKVKK